MVPDICWTQVKFLSSMLGMSVFNRCEVSFYVLLCRDDVEWDKEQEKQAQMKVTANSEVRCTVEQKQKYETNADQFWDSFYDVHSNRFFKDRHWLFTEFPELTPKNTEKLTIFEIGCGVGNTVFPILQYTKSENVFVYCCDFSANAIGILKENKDYDTSRCEAFVLDATSENWNVPFEENSLDIVVLVFVLSAINPEKYYMDFCGIC